MITNEGWLGASIYLTLSSLKHYEVKHYYHITGEKNEAQKNDEI